MELNEVSNGKVTKKTAAVKARTGDISTKSVPDELESTPWAHKNLPVSFFKPAGEKNGKPRRHSAPSCTPNQNSSVIADGARLGRYSSFLHNNPDLPRSLEPLHERRGLEDGELSTRNTHPHVYPDIPTTTTGHISLDPQGVPAAYFMNPNEELFNSIYSSQEEYLNAFGQQMVFGNRPTMPM